ncbi:MAG: ATP-dependent Clp protease ATP-binding subunit, partial [Kiritimatiellae bacterium]|nr:ATP-dependent Clp protease ATP-binding subunit [Kiritimatiellia bacterium]
MDTPKTSRNLDKALRLAEEEADRLDHPYVGTEHVLIGIAMAGRCFAGDILKELGVEPDTVRDTLRGMLREGDGGTKLMGKRDPTPRMRKVMAMAQMESERMGALRIGTEHVLLAMTEEREGLAFAALSRLGVTQEKVAEAIAKLSNAGRPDDGQDGEGGPDGGDAASVEEGKSSGDGQQRAPGRGPVPEKDMALNAFGRNLVKQAREGLLDPVIGRKAEMERLIQILCRRTKNNAALLGEAG